MVGGSVAFDPHQVTPGVPGIADRKVDEEAGHPDLRHRLETGSRKRRGYGNLEVTVRCPTRPDIPVQVARLGEGEEVPECDHSPLGTLRQRDVFRAHRAEHVHSPLRACEENVQSAPADIGIDRSEALVDPAAHFLGAVGTGDVDHVALVTLHVFEVLDEQRLFGLQPRLDRGPKTRVLLRQVLHGTLDLVTLFSAHRDHAERLVRALQHVRVHGFRDDARLLHVAPVHESAPGHARELHPEVRGLCMRCREDDQLPVVERVVRERDQVFVLGAVVPGQPPRLEDGHRGIQDALRVFDGRGVFVIVANHLVEEARRWQLLRIPDHHELTASRNRP